MWKFLQKIPDRGDWIAPLLVMVLGWGAFLFWVNHTGKLAAQANIENRVIALETHQATQDVKMADQQSHLEHIEAQVDKLVEWALGHK